MLRRALLASLVALALVAPAPCAWAVKDWYDYYLEARDRLIPQAKWDAALENLRQAVRLKPQSALKEQTYGLQFEDYLPYYYMGVCQLRKGAYDEALQLFKREEQQGPIRRIALFSDLTRDRAEAERGLEQRVATRVREEVLRLEREAEDLARKDKAEEALARFADALSLAAQLDSPDLLRRLHERSNKLRAEVERRRVEDERARRLEHALQEGRRLLQEEDPAGAVLRFDDALGLEPGNAKALEGKREAQERILATLNRKALEAAFREGKALFEAQKYEEALQPLSTAAADPSMGDARALLTQAQAVVEGLRRERERGARIALLMAEGERLMAERSYSDAQVRFDAVLLLDPQNVTARERRRFAEDRAERTLLARWLPNEPPLFMLIEPAAPETEIEGESVTLIGVAYDDKGLARIQFKVGGKLVREIVAAPHPDSGDVPRSVRFDPRLLLEPGVNEIEVIATDTMDLARTEKYRIVRRLRFYETRAFLPSAAGTAAGLIGLGLAFQRARQRRAVRRRFNPYIAGAPVMDDAMFFGRQKLLARILNVLHHNSLMITGERRIGKTTFLYHLRKALETDDATDYRFFPALTDLQGVPETKFFQTVMADVVDALALSPETLRSLRFNSADAGDGPEAAGSDAAPRDDQPPAPATSGAERRDSLPAWSAGGPGGAAQPPPAQYDGREFSHDLQRVIEELKTRTPKRAKLALLIDEVDVLNEYSEPINQRLRAIFMKTFSEHLVAIMSGVGIKRRWKSEGSPWYNFFDEIELQAFTRQDAEELIRKPVEGVFRYDAEAVEAVLDWSELKPYIIQKFCIHAVNRMIEHGRTTVALADVEAVRDAARHDDATEHEPERLQQAASA